MQKKLNFTELKQIKEKLVNELFLYLNKTLPKGWQQQMGNIKEVLQWGSAAKLIFVYLINEKIHTLEMNDKVEALKQIQFKIAKTFSKSVLTKKISKNIQQAEFIIDKRLLLKSLHNNDIYLCEDTFANIMTEIVDNQKKHENFIKQISKYDLVAFALQYIGVDPESFKYKESKNKDLVERDLNKGYGIKRAKSFYKELIRTEQDKELKTFLRVNSKVFDTDNFLFLPNTYYR